MSEKTFTMGAFRLDRRLGVGGMAEVWAAKHRTFGGAAAVKVMLDRAAGSQMLRESFVAEARSHAALNHPNIVRLLDYGRVSASDEPPPGVIEGDAYLVMERADSTARDDALPRTWDELRTILHDILTGLAYSHARGFIHRDLKPENVLRFGASSPVYKLADFGIAHSIDLDETADRDTLSVTVGTPHYMAPEQFCGRWYEFGPPTDLYALGCVAFELATGYVPFNHSGVMALATAHLRSAVPGMELRFDVPTGFEPWVWRLLEKNPRDRFAFAADAAYVLEQLSGDFSGRAAAAQMRATAPQIALDEAPTIVDALTDLMLGDTLDAIDLELDEGVAGPPSGTSASGIAPVPQTWRPDVAPQQTDDTLGLGLLALRETPVVGYGEVRDELWSMVREVVEDAEPRVVVLRGGSSAPIDALGRWLYRRIGETGAAVTRDVFFTRAGGPREGLVALLEHAFATWGMRDDEAARRIADFVVAHVREDVATSCREIATDLVLRARGSDQWHGRAPTRGERDRAVAEVLESAAYGRPHMVYISGAQWGRDVFGFARRILERPAAALVVLGMSDDELDQRQRQQLDELLSVDRVQQVNVREPTSAEELQLARAMLPLSDETAAALVSVSRGDEVALRLLLDGLRERGGLTATRDGYRVATDVDLPATRAEVFAHAVSRCLARDRSLAEALELSAVLGRAPDPAELEALLAQAGVQPEQLRRLVEEHGLATSISDRWWFVHDGIVDVLQQTSRAAGRWQMQNRRCAEMLLERATSHAPELLVRAAHHFVAAGDAERSLKPMFQAMRAVLAADTERARALLERYEALCEQLALDADHTARLDGAVIRMALLRASGEVEASRDVAWATIETSRRLGHPVAEGLALRHVARLQAGSRNLNEAAALLMQAESAARVASEPLEQAASARVLGQVYDQMGRFDASTEALERASDLYADGEDIAGQVRVMSILASVLSHAGKLDEAWHKGQEALRFARKAGGAGAAEASNVLGDIARMREDYGEARERYLEARARFAFGAPFNQQIVDLNLAVVDVAEGHIDRAEQTFTNLRTIFEELRLMYVVAIATAGLAACAALNGDAAAARRYLADAVDALSGSPDADVAELLDIAYERTSDDDLRRDLAPVLIDLHRGLGADERAVELGG